MNLWWAKYVRGMTIQREQDIEGETIRREKSSNVPMICHGNSIRVVTLGWEK
jgi:hypothetical protein